MKVIFVSAHPDDESFSSAGTISALTKKGAVVKIITPTRGEKGQLGNPPLCSRGELGKFREKELKRAAKVIGISKIYFLNFIDGTLNKKAAELTAEISKIIDKEKPDIVITFNSEGVSRHPDHIQVSKCTTQVFKKYMEKAKKHVRLYYVEMPRSLVEKLEKAQMAYTAFGRIKGTPDSQITTIVDISKTIEQKIKALKCHLTQKKDWARFLKRMDYKEFKREFFRLVMENRLI